jgi:peptidoglycan/LPS O-acetylase OafA/YrhL
LVDRIHSLDALRAAAASAVAFFHFAYIVEWDWPQLYRVLYHGMEGVYAFFVISGMVIPLALDRRAYSLARYFLFLKQRWIRLTPPFVFVAILFYLSMTPMEQWLSQSWLVVANALLVAPWVGGHWIVEIFWTLCVEFQYYILIGLFIIGLRQDAWWRSRLVLLCWISLGGISWWMHDKAFVWYHAPVFTLGIISWMRVAGRMKNLEFYVWSAALLPLVYFINGEITTVIAYLTWLIIRLNWSSPRALNWVGERSYSLYLVHLTTGGFCLQVCKPYLNGPQERLMAFIGAYLISLIAAQVLYKKLEIPSIHWAQRAGKN